MDIAFPSDLKVPETAMLPDRKGQDGTTPDGDEDISGTQKLEEFSLFKQ